MGSEALSIEQQWWNLCDALADSVLDMTHEEIMEEAFEDQFTLPLVGGVDECVRDANGNIVGEPQLEPTATDYDAKLITEYIALCINQHEALTDKLAADQAENARKDALIEALEGMINSARNFNGDKWGVRRYTEIPAEGPHELEGKWYGWKDDWNGGVDGPHTTALEAFEALTAADRTGRDGE